VAIERRLERISRSLKKRMQAAVVSMATMARTAAIPQ
jgi:hypothetical protein